MADCFSCYELFEDGRFFFLQNMIYKFIKPDLLILIPVLFLVGNFLKKSSIKDNKIPLIIGVIGVILSSIYIISKIDIFNFKELLMAIFAGFCQGILVAGSSVFVKQLKIQSNKL